MTPNAHRNDSSRVGHQTLMRGWPHGSLQRRGESRPRPGQSTAPGTNGPDPLPVCGVTAALNIPDSHSPLSLKVPNQVSCSGKWRSACLRGPAVHPNRLGSLLRAWQRYPSRRVASSSRRVGGLIRTPAALLRANSALGLSAQHRGCPLVWPPTSSRARG